MKTYPIIFQILVIVVIGAVALVSNVFAQWIPPVGPPPGDNAVSPLNVSSLAQSKISGLLLNTGGAPYGLIVPSGKVGIGTADPQATLDVKGSIKISPTSSARAGRMVCWTDQNLLGYCLLGAANGTYCFNCVTQ